MPPEPTATVHPVIAATVAASPISPEGIIALIVTAVLGGVITLAFFLLGQQIVRAWTAGDKITELGQKAVVRDMDHSSEFTRRESDRTYEALKRELDQIHGKLDRIADTQVDIQKAILKVELRQDGVEEYIESQKEVTRIMGRRQRSVT